MLINDADIIIVGAGASGMAAAWAAMETYPEGRVVLLEKMPRPGRKIMITGKGRCNFTNFKDWEEFKQHVHPSPNFLRPSFYNLNPERLIGIFRENGMESVIERGDRVFPASHISSDVVDTLCDMTKKRGAEIICGCPVTSIRKENGMFVLHTPEGEWQCRKLIIATGGMSYPKTGSTGDGYKWAAQFGHRITSCFPSLTAIVPEGYKRTENRHEGDLKGHLDRNLEMSEWGASLNGISLTNIGIRLIIDGNVAEDEFGDIDFTDGGVEGPSGFRISRKCVNAITNGSKVQLVIDLKPAVEESDLDGRIRKLWQEICKDRRSEGKPYKTRFGVLLGKLMPRELCEPFMKSSTGADHTNLAGKLKNWKMEVAGFVGYERAVITAGGVRTEDISVKTLESKFVEGLYFAGEVMDLDADTGGYNLHIAFSTGALAGKNAALSVMKLSENPQN